MTMRTMRTRYRSDILIAPFTAMLLTMTLIAMSNFAENALQLHAGSSPSFNSELGDSVGRAGVKLRDRIRNRAAESDIQEAESQPTHSPAHDFLAAAAQVANSILPGLIDTEFVEPTFSLAHASLTGQSHARAVHAVSKNEHKPNRVPPTASDPEAKPGRTGDGKHD